MTTIKPTFNAGTSTISIPTVEGVDFKIGGQIVEGDVEISKNTVVRRFAKPGFKLAKGSETEFKFVVSEPAEKPAEVEVKTEDKPKPAEAIEGLSAGNTPQSPGQDSGRGFGGGSVNR